ncbi:hypothetical protein DCS_07916 [Drechmeria coniospora]|uniref:Uncharacterized protein n=1 Tax=Drechmeria coniospora TaxID=98403 RepID=A0A151GFY4_DRECN|nr:hypothetical protein DCS_07916 [Drechmeria coniospora]KYK55951.1 hypothetical protein DCS_07916 [Drechmeria coniospora]
MDEDNDRYPLHTAAREGKVAKAEGLLKTDPKLSQKRDDDGRYAIHWAVSSNNLDIVVLLVNHPAFDPDVQDGSGWTPLMISASVPNGEAVLKMLLQKGANVNEKNSNGQSALHFVASKKNMDIARMLIEAKPAASTRIRDRRGQYPIHRAAAAGSEPMVNLLLQNMSPLNPTDDEGYTPLHHAVAEGHGDVAVALLKHGADFGIKNRAEELALDLAPDKEVRLYIIQGAEREGVDLSL